MKIGTALKLIIFSITFNGLSIISDAQETGLKGNVNLFWGWNRGWFTNSDIRFKGVNYDFTLYDVQANDRQTPVGLDPYLNPVKLTVPQTNFRIGYFISDHYCVIGGFDHMKYVMVQDQTVKINGEINVGESSYNGKYENSDIVLSSSILQYEHTDGLNYIHAGLLRYDRILDLPNLRTGIFFNGGLEAGMVMPRTAVKFMDQELSDSFHISGYGMSLQVGLSIFILKVITIRSELKGGFINLPDVKTSNSNADKAQQHFFFLQPNILLGATIPLFAKKK
jgi:hypothetical protein